MSNLFILNNLDALANVRSELNSGNIVKVFYCSRGYMAKVTEFPIPEEIEDMESIESSWVEAERALREVSRLLN